VDGTVGFTGGAGFADQWLYDERSGPKWRDTMLRVEGGAVTGLEATFSENWLEASGEMVIAPKYFPQPVSACSRRAKHIGWSEHVHCPSAGTRFFGVCSLCRTRIPC
jgi:cardiolipin synthase